MSQITKTSLLFAFLLLLSVFTLAGCGSSNSQSTFNSDTGAHPAGWLPSGHKQEAVADLENCTQCHGSDYKGGISNFSCAQCHIGAPLSVHPVSWGPFTDVLHASFARSEGTSTCANAACHGSDLTGTGGTGPSCTLCHLGGVDSFHPAEWGVSLYLLHDDYVRTNGTSGCASAACHGSDLTGTGGTGPSCTLCHLGGVYSKHPVEWGDSAIKLHGGYVTANSEVSCGNLGCHGAKAGGGVPTGPSCDDCH